MLAAAQRRHPDPDPRAERRARPRQPPAGRPRATRSPPAFRACPAATADRGEARRIPAIRCARRSLRRGRHALSGRRAAVTVRLLVLGGSQGARVFADVVPPALGACRRRCARASRSCQQARPEDLERVARRLCRARHAAEVSPASSPTCPRGWPRAHLVICRAGASTVAELAGDRPAGASWSPAACHSTTTRPPMRRPSPRPAARLLACRQSALTADDRLACRIARACRPRREPCARRAAAADSRGGAGRCGASGSPISSTA